ncbi:MAG: hypothetical protein AAGJ83_02220, partial [Planctomycetota bacterium]
MVFISSCAAVYHFAADRLLAVPAVDQVQPRTPTKPGDLAANLSDIFPEACWQRGDCKRLLTGSGTMLFEELDQISDSQWKLKPLTLVIGRGLSVDGRSETPIVLEAPEGAEIQFAESLDMTIGSAPPIQVGRMIGDVTIRQAGRMPESERLRLRTRNVWIDNQKVWTTERIAMQVRGTQLVGRDLTIHLAASAASAAKADRPSTLLDRMELVYLEQCTLPLGRSRQNQADGPIEAGDVDDGEDNGVVSIACRNGLKYDFALDRLSLADEVVLTRSVDQVVVDRFTCDAVNLVLRDPADQTLDREGPLDWLRRIHATGTPARLRLGQHDFELDADTIDFDAEAGLLRADGGNGIRLRREYFEAQLQSLVYQFNPDDAQQLGNMEVNGAGVLVCTDPSVLLRELKWTRAFVMEPLQALEMEQIGDPHRAGKIAFRIEGNLKARLRDGGNAQADKLQGTLRSTRVGSETKWMPDVIHATDDVAVRAAQVIANTQQLSLYFEPVEVLAESAVGTRSDRGPGAVAEVVSQPLPGEGTRGSLASWSVGGFTSDEVEDGSGTHAPVARPSPRISGDFVSAKMLLTPQGIQTKDVSMQGAVSVEHHARLGTKWVPVEIVGETMRAVRNSVMKGSGKDFIQIGSGPESPAHLKMGDGFFIGPVIKVWPDDNLVQVEGAGRLRVPSDLLRGEDSGEVAKTPSSPADMTRSIQWTRPPECEWGEAMQFDGRVAVLGGGVEVQAAWDSGAEPWDATLVGDQMQIGLSDQVTLLDRGSFADVGLQQIRIVESRTQPVVVRARQLDASSRLQGVHVIHCHQLDFLPEQGGQLIAAGPGWYRTWMRSNSKQSLVSPRPRRNDAFAGEVLQGAHLTFLEQLVGDLGNESLTFTGGVRTAVREVNSWDDEVDVSDMERLAAGEMTLDCGELRFGMSPGVPDHVRDLPG